MMSLARGFGGGHEAAEVGPQRIVGRITARSRRRVMIRLYWRARRSVCRHEVLGSIIHTLEDFRYSLMRAALTRLSIDGNEGFLDAF